MRCWVPGTTCVYISRVLIAPLQFSFAPHWPPMSNRSHFHHLLSDVQSFMNSEVISIQSRNFHIFSFNIFYKVYSDSGTFFRWLWRTKVSNVKSCHRAFSAILWLQFKKDRRSLLSPGLDQFYQFYARIRWWVHKELVFILPETLKWSLEKDLQYFH